MDLKKDDKQVVKKNSNKKILKYSKIKQKIKQIKSQYSRQNADPIRNFKFIFS